ncbi:reverse transcriptase/maturase family protein [Clostridium kluyveri]|uniref:Predicted reverse transcriptase/maturase family protein n=2 Tax=Clostridium kluyveri TaxID=1534 RepID=A5N448_CLOK5|nr:reverse transcriptase/maturase family protein [Clostridium kluyveri]EDK35894.1 Predicted reverse transcriptase/maturase family protein [Clostridium kluyveri DSM 555]BAH08511.1 hypothetical protein CKR_3460 [Clostridium kluyveri NBRC 12016]
MQKAELILAILKDKSNNNPNYKFQRIYRYLFNIDFYFRAYSQVYSAGENIGNVVTEKVHSFNNEGVHKIIEKLKNESYCPESLEKSDKQNKKHSQIKGLYDNLIQQIIVEILQSIYNVNFSVNSHAFIPNKNCHTALYKIKTTCSGARWAVKGNIESCFYNINYDFVIKSLCEKISDGRFINLIRKFLAAGYTKEKKNCDTWSGISQRESLANILINIYLDKFDKYINKEFGQVKYTRYLDNFIIFISGTKDLAEYMIEKIKVFLKDKLNIETTEEEIFIIDLNKQRVKFLGYEITKLKHNFKDNKTDKSKEKMDNEIIQLLIPAEVIRKRIKPFILNGKPIHNNSRINLSVFKIISLYNREIIDLYNYYCLASDVNAKVRKFKFYHYLSLVKTLARKEQISVKQVINRYGIVFKGKDKNVLKKVVGINHMTKNGIKTIIYCNESLKRKSKPLANVNDIIWK